ncbi:glycerol-3-phosphate transporter [Actinobacillus equuli]|nr:glycerol-3-phosphate transporter [Actinobacillus equuli]
MGNFRYCRHVHHDFLNGWFQGMGWPPCGRTMVHWWSKSERGSIVSIWNCAHNVGGMVPGLMVFLAGAVYFNTTGVEATAKDVWQQALYYPGIAAMIAAIPIYFMMKDTPQSCGLPPVENGAMIIRIITMKTNLNKS